MLKQQLFQLVCASENQQNYKHMERIKYIGFMVVLYFTIPSALVCQHTMEFLNRGVIAVPAGAGKALVSWRLLNSDQKDIAFNVYRQTSKDQFVKLNQTPLQNVTNYLDTTLGSRVNVEYKIIQSVDKEDVGLKHHVHDQAELWSKPYHSIRLKTPEGYSVNDGSVGDLDGDGDYEIIVHMTGRGHDNSHNGYTSEAIFHAYTMEGTLLWSINLGKNIREGAHYNPFLVYDFDGDGKAEIVMKTADGSMDSEGTIIGDAAADYRNEKGHILSGPEYLSIFDGLTGKVMSTVAYEPCRHPQKSNPSSYDLKQLWGDGRGNRSERYLAGVAYLDGKHPSIVMSRGYYERTAISSWDWDGQELKQRWLFDSDDGTKQSRKVHGQGNHSLSVADVDGDGKDEIIFGSAVIDDDGTALHSTGFGHGDALHVTDLDPENPGLEIFTIQERFDDAGMNFRDAKTGTVLWKIPSVKADEQGGDKGEGPGRGVAFNVDPRYPGNECWAFGAGIRGMYSAKGELITKKTPRSCNFAIWWDGDLLREILDKTYIAKWNWEEESFTYLLRDEQCRSINGTKSNPVLSADLFGDWREEVIWRTRDNSELRIYSTPIPCEKRFITLMQDPTYRLSVAWQNVGYNQPPHPGFYIGE